MHICMAESFLCSPETITTLLIHYTPIQNKKFFFKFILKKKITRKIHPGCCVENILCSDNSGHRPGGIDERSCCVGPACSAMKQGEEVRFWDF